MFFPSVQELLKIDRLQACHYPHRVLHPRINKERPSKSMGEGSRPVLAVPMTIPVFPSHECAESYSAECITTPPNDSYTATLVIFHLRKCWLQNLTLLG